MTMQAAQAVEAALTNIEYHLTHLGQIDVSLAPSEQLALASLSEPAFIDNLIQNFADKIAQALLQQNASTTDGREHPYQLLKGTTNSYPLFQLLMVLFTFR